ncbi:MAG: sugar ABC transporter permease [Euzebyales bacterium]|nr:sugar ABC transporter permease [Euzebyales bacterium]MBA3621276.1 sugar ABC transporter permease [Euzebyales bacterium]
MPWRKAAAFLLPAFLLYSLFIVYPLISALQYSVFTWRGTAQGAFVGVANFAELVTRQPLAGDLLGAFGHNAMFFAGTMVIQNVAGLAFAVLLHRSRKGKRFLQSAFTMPFLLSPLVVGYLWSLILNPLFGPLNAVLRGAGLESLALPWLGNPTTALPVVVLVNAWQWVGFPMLLFGAALAGIPEEYEQAARVDGAGSWQAFRRVTLPLLTPVIGTVSVLTFIGNFNIFGLVYAMGGSQGGPAGSTDVLGLLFYRTAFRGGSNAIGVSSALAVVMFAFIFGLSLAATALLRRREARLT